MSEDQPALTISEAQEAELYRLLRLYNQEAERCSKARAFLAGCVMAGAELETGLLLMVNAYPEEAFATGKCPRKRQAVKPLFEWNLGELLQVAKAADWLPSGLVYGKDEWSSRKAKIGDYAEVVREVRNLAHPARYVEDHYRKRVTKGHVDFAFNTINSVSSWLYSRVEKSLLERMKAEGRTLEKRKAAGKRGRSRRPDDKAHAR